MARFLASETMLLEMKYWSRISVHKSQSSALFPEYLSIRPWGMEFAILEMTISDTVGLTLVIQAQLGIITNPSLGLNVVQQILTEVVVVIQGSYRMIVYKSSCSYGVIMANK